MPFEFRPAVRQNVSLLVGLAGGTGSGKTYSALRLAKGIAGDRPFAGIDTEAGRMLHYADRFRFDHGDLKPPFRPSAYVEAILAADKAKYPVILVDSMSHEWAGDGGIIDWHDAELERMTRGQEDRRDAMNMRAWIQPKVAHKEMVQCLLQIRAHLILCFRAEPKVDMVKDAAGKTQIVEKKGLTGLNGWFPVTERNLPFELTASFLLMAEQPGVPLPIKLQEQHRSIFPAKEPITEESGRRLVEWAKGGAAVEAGVDWVARITNAATIDELGAVNRQLKSAKFTLSDEDLGSLRALYDSRMTALKGASSTPSQPNDPPPVTADDINWSHPS